jgi:hypothetical protein
MTEPTTPTDALGIVPIGFVRGGRAEPIDDDWGEMTSRIVLDDRWPADALAGLEAFSHLDVVYVFDRVDDARSPSAHVIHAATPSGPRSGSSPSGRKDAPTGSASARVRSSASMITSSRSAASTRSTARRSST